MSSLHLSALKTDLSWKDLAHKKDLLEQVEEIKNWLKRSPKDAHQKKRKLKPGFRSLFYGPVGSGKKSTAALLGKELEQPVYRIDLSMVESKYIGETEKNIDQIFDKAGQQEAILFFDEADALFGKRTDVKDANDRYANQAISYLLQRIENYEGLVILATNQKDNINDAIIRKMNLVIAFSTK